MIGWRCLECDAKGETTGTESGADVKHVRATTHATVSASNLAAWQSSKTPTTPPG